MFKPTVGRLLLLFVPIAFACAIASGNPVVADGFATGFMTCKYLVFGGNPVDWNWPEQYELHSVWELSVFFGLFAFVVIGMSILVAFVWAWRRSGKATS